MVTTTHMLQSLTTTTALLNRTSSITVCCFSSRNGGRSGGSRWDSRAGNGQQRFRFDEEELRANGGEKDAEFGFGAATKQRIWWSDDDSSRGDSFDDEDEDFEGFGELEGSIGFSWIFKVLQAFGWMVPAVLVSMLLGTGTNTIVMALALPLAQSALSLIMDAFSGTSYDRARPKSRTRKRSYARAKTNARTREGEQNTQNGKGARGYGSNEKEAKTTQNFGGWDELDNPGTTSANKTPKTTPAQDPNKARLRNEGKLSRRISKKETPLLLRLLIAVFPFLGSWTKPY
ncbi:uncharacterized protein LOC116009806 isoform X3 [Ipomoea triloba]|uniref:uncharacterized protein LOC116009806 isoform X3 n=1 Tax=Ipomoea triloba TaxID=35885 RepID=UPI00125D13E1|nr:uncharacterized protein LOC116009806 isoform X3 [Ipomoea triloba]